MIFGLKRLAELFVEAGGPPGLLNVVNGDKEMVVAGFVSGLWLLRPQSGGAWKIESIDRNSGGFEHASILADLDEDGRDELYVASDKEKLVRRYDWDGKRLVGRVIYRRKEPGSVFTWNIMPIPSSPMTDVCKRMVRPLLC